MWDKLIEMFSEMGMQLKTSESLARLVMFLFMLLICYVANLVTRRLILRIVTKLVNTNKYEWDDKLLEHKVFHRLSYLVTPLIIQFFVDYFPEYTKIIERGVAIYVTAVFMMVIDAILSTVDDIYRTYEISKTRPMKGVLQGVKIVIYIIGGILIIAAMIGESPVIILGGISALTAVFMLVFQNSILGFAAGIQLTSNDMIRIGDWIEVPKCEANGTVIELSLWTVKVQNFDRTITSVPANALISDAFKNWRGMQESGGRRIMRAMYIDMNSICFCTDEMLEQLKRIEFIKDYLESKKVEIENYNKEKNIDLSEIANGRRLTNIGVFRIYVTNYLRNHPGIRTDMALMVRQLAPTPQGLPLEIYAFSDGTDWTSYENTQGDIFDHLFAVINEFGLRVFQSPTGQDIAK